MWKYVQYCDESLIIYVHTCIDIFGIFYVLNTLYYSPYLYNNNSNHRNDYRLVYHFLNENMYDAELYMHGNFFILQNL
jgi:hypothetical protein